MHSVKCFECGFVGWADAELCKKCGASLSHSAGASGQVQGYSSNPPGARTRPISQVKKGLAIWSLVIGIVNLFTLGLLGVGAILGITLAVVALRKINQNPLKYGGKEFATAGLVTSILSFAIIVPVGLIAAIAIPNLLAARRAANEGSTIQALRVVSAAESTYSSVHGTYGTLEELAAEQLIDREIGAGTRHGYLIRIDVSNSESENPVGFQLVAVPLTYPNSGRRSFYLDETGIIRASDAQGRDATKLDDPLNTDNGYSRAPGSRRYDPDTEY